MPFGGAITGLSARCALKRSLQLHTSRTCPRAPLCTYSATSGWNGPEWPWWPACVTTSYFRCAAARRSASSSE